MNILTINPTLLFIIGELIIVTLLTVMTFYMVTHMEKPHKSSKSHS